jgi:peptidoglycan/xylan/chitin deacetylase (PgdA/CDA1 family)
MVVQLGAAGVPFERGVVILSFDTEQIWGYLDMFAEEPFVNRYPKTIEVHENLLTHLCQARVPATWFLVGGLALAGSKGIRDPRFHGLPDAWTRRVRAGDEASAPLWYRRGFIERLRDATPFQEIGIHGGLTHLIWTHPHTTPNVATRELKRAVAALEEIGVRATSFSYPRDEEAYPHLLAANGILCYRGRLQARAHLLGRTFRGRLLRIADEVRRASPLVVWPDETQPGLWNIPSSMFIYPLGRTRSRFVGTRSRVERFARGVEEAARHRGIFHFCLHPENLAEHPRGLEVLDDCLEALVKVRDRGDVEVLTVGEMAVRMEQRKSEAFAAAQGTLRAARSAPGTGTL